jgi:hypothetical protein
MSNKPVSLPVYQIFVWACQGYTSSWETTDVSLIFSNAIATAQDLCIQRDGLVVTLKISFHLIGVSSDTVT